MAQGAGGVAGIAVAARVTSIGGVTTCGTGRCGNDGRIIVDMINFRNHRATVFLLG